MKKADLCSNAKYVDRCPHLHPPKARLLVPFAAVIRRQPPRPGDGRHQETLRITSSLNPFHNSGYVSLEKVLTLRFLLHKMKIILLLTASVSYGCQNRLCDSE